jgi:hypothetical protein
MYAAALIAYKFKPSSFKIDISYRMSEQPDPATQPKGEKGFLGDLLSGKTPAVRNIEKAYSRAGASNHHTPGAATKLGSQDQTETSEHQGVGSAKFAEGISDQRAEVCALSLFCALFIRLRG